MSSPQFEGVWFSPTATSATCWDFWHAVLGWFQYFTFLGCTNLITNWIRNAQTLNPLDKRPTEKVNLGWSVQRNDWKLRLFGTKQVPTSEFSFAQTIHPMSQFSRPAWNGFLVGKHQVGFVPDRATARKNWGAFHSATLSNTGLACGPKWSKWSH